MVEVNRAVAVALAAGPPRPGSSCSRRCSPTPALARYQPLHAAHAELLRRAGDRGGAAPPTTRAIELSANAVERAELERRLGTLR